MADRWLYIHAGAAHGPVDADKLAQLARVGKLLPTDPVWPVGEDMRGAVEARTMLNPKVFPSTQPTVEETLANPAPVGTATPDWLADVETAPEPPVSHSADVEVVNESPDVEVVIEETRPEKLPPPPSKPRPPAAPIAKPAHASEGPEEAGPGFRRRDLFLLLGLGIAGVGVAVAAGLYFAGRSQRKADDAPPNEE